jgi:adenylosuccinate lyase
MEESKTQIMMP